MEEQLTADMLRDLNSGENMSDEALALIEDNLTPMVNGFADVVNQADWPTPHEIPGAAMNAYIAWPDTSSDFQVKVNKAARSGGATKEMLEMDAAFVMKLGKPTTLYRGAVLPTPPKIGSTVTDKGYQSTSTSEAVAACFGFGRSQGQVLGIKVPKAEGSTCVFRLNTPKGIPIMPADRQIGEIVLPRGTSYKVTGRVQKNGVWYLDADVVQP